MHFIRTVDGCAHEGNYLRTEQEGVVSIRVFDNARYINWQNCEPNRMTANGETYAIPGELRIPVHLTTAFHPTHLKDHL